MRSIKESIYTYLNLGEDSNDHLVSTGKAINKTSEEGGNNGDKQLDLVKVIMANWNNIWGEPLNEKVAFANIHGNEMVIIASDTNVAAYIKTVYCDIIDRINEIIEKSNFSGGQSTTSSPMSKLPKAGEPPADASYDSRPGSNAAVEHIKIVVVGKSITRE